METDALQTAVGVKAAPAPNLAGYFQKSLAPSLAAALPRHLTPDRMSRVCLTAIRTVKDLWRCSELSFAGEILKLAQLGLEPNTPLGHAYLIPRNGKNGWEVTTIIGYQGYLELARRSGVVKSIYAHVVRKGDEFDYELGLHKRLTHRPTGDESAPITHVYCVAHVEGSEPLFEVLSAAAVEKRRGRGANGPAWKSDWEAMAKKSAVRALWPWLPKSAEMASVIDADSDAPTFVDVQATASTATSAIDAINAAIVDVSTPNPTTGEVLEPEDLASAAAKIDAGDL